MKNGLFMLFLLVNGAVPSTFAQKPIDEMIYADINKLRAQGIDTIVRFNPHVFSASANQSDTLVGLGIVHPFEIQYLTYQSNGRSWSRKYVNYCNENCDNTGLAISKDLDTPDTALFRWLHAHEMEIKKEDLYPYVYRLRTDEKEHYDKLEVDHPSLYLIGIYHPGEDLVKQFDGMGLRQQRSNFPNNLNYAVNHSTKLYVFYLLVEAYFLKLDKSFVF